MLGYSFVKVMELLVDWTVQKKNMAISCLCL